MMPREKPPEWVVGLIIALALFGLLVILAQALGFGDDPSFEGDGIRRVLVV